MAYVPNVQRGLNARLARPGRYSPQEFIIHRIGKYVIDGVCGTGPISPARRMAAE